MKSAFSPIVFPERDKGRVAITNVTVIPMDSERVLPDHTVVIEDGVIQLLGPASRVDVAGARVIDGRGQYLMPGLADMYTHYRDPAESVLYIARGITTVRLVSGSPFQLALARMAERGEFPSPWVIPVSPSIDGVGPTGRTDLSGTPMTDPSQAESLIGHFVQRGYRHIKAVSLLGPDLLRALGRAAAAAGVRLGGNCPNAMTHEEAMDAGMTCFEQLHLIARGHMRRDAPRPDFWDRFDPIPGTRLDFDAIRRLASLAAERGVWNVPTLIFHQRCSQPVEISMQDPDLRYVPESTVRDWESTIVRFGRRAKLDPEPWRAAARERAEAFLRVVAILHEEGAPLMTGTDSLNPYNVQGRALHLELANFVRAGMSPYQALRCATAEPARFVGEEDVWGTLAPSRRADLVLLRSDPLRSVDALADIAAVVVNGYVLTSSMLTELLEQRAAAVSRTPAVPAADLEAWDESGKVAAEGGWIERLVGEEFGRVRFRFARLEDGGWRLEECHSGATPRRHPERRSARLTLDSGLRVREAFYRVESFAGDESATVAWTARRGYSVKHQAVDGWRSEGSLASDPLLPSERLSVSAPVLLLGQLPLDERGRLRVLDVADGAAAAIDTEVTLLESPPGERRWRWTAGRTAQTTDQAYRLSEDGRLLGLQETTSLLWPRELTPGAQETERSR